ncbi:EAL domain-containing protein [Listeria seeligeri]|uniref:EAL domain-containing protein n=1 Tax=Listeria seeligeri TaxID=1640 RepID=UPI00162479D9|nr:EAL domain-containing protein [Listeria seeligeri]MBC1754518.1 EAL domain-containing protein [Listeria seeligeri]MBC1788221.1 EAL domain-containing protein [Listeria seeligeri]MBC2235299.1 EAL domain-containing protein [Listeria seeligeri]
MNKPSVSEIIGQNLFDTIYEPIVKVENTQVFGYESLTRLQTDHWNAISDFIEEAEQDGMQKAFELLTIHNAVKCFHKNGDTPLFVNISYDTFLENREELQETLLDNGKIVFEFLETSRLPQERMNDLDEQLLLFQKNHKTKFAIDDFGSGYADLHRVFAHHSDFVKTDRLLLRDLFQSDGKKIFFEQLNNYVKKHHKALIVEGVETKEQLTFLQDIGIPFAQGYYFHKGDKKKI